MKMKKILLLSIVLFIVVFGLRMALRTPPKPATSDSLVSVGKPINEGGTTSDAAKNHEGPTKVSLDSVLSMAQEALDRLDREVQDYTATILKRERIQNKLGEESKVVAKIREAKSDGSQKLEVYLRFETPASARGREVLWRDGKNENKLIAHEAGYLNIMRAHLDPQGVVAMLGNRYPISDIGIRNLLIKLVEKGKRAKLEPDCQVIVDEQQSIGGRPCTLIQVTHPHRKPDLEFHVAQIFFDQELRLPIRYACFSWPETGSRETVLEEEYTYLDLQLNVGLQDRDFDPDNPEYKYPK